MELNPGARLGPYEIVSRIGAGGMGEVYRAHDARLHRDVAVKVLPQAFSNRAAQERFQREARAASALNHPHICAVYDVGAAGDLHYLVMELLDGRTLRKQIGGGTLGIKDVLALGIQVADALGAAHSKGIVHRDIKPDNIFVTEGSNAKVLDFGLARQDLPADPEALTEEMLTAPGTAVGTIAYMSPEQARGQLVDARTDLWSLGVVMYEMATGSRPFDGPTSPMVFDALLNTSPQPLTRLNPKAPAELERIVGKLLEKSRELRYQSTSELRIDLERLQTSLNRSASDGSQATPLKKTVLRQGIAVAVGLILCAGGILLWQRHGQAQPLTDRDTIVLADFTNTTGDPDFDGTLRQGLSIELEQSPFLSLIPEERVQRVLPLMGQAADARLTPKIAREICERTAGAAVLEGSIAPLGAQYVLGLRARNCNTGNVLDEEQVQVARKEDVLNALSRVAGQLRTRVGESLAMVQAHSAPLADVSTPSLEALKAYGQGLKILASGGDVAATPYFKRAVEIDSRFAIAYARIGLSYGSAGETALATESFIKAHQLRERASDEERFFIDANYDLQVTGNLERAQQTCVEWERVYPRVRSGGGQGFLAAMIYPVFGEYEKALAQATEQVNVDPTFRSAICRLPSTTLSSGTLMNPKRPCGRRPIARWKYRSLSSSATITPFFGATELPWGGRLL